MYDGHRRSATVGQAVGLGSTRDGLCQCLDRKKETESGEKQFSHAHAKYEAEGDVPRTLQAVMAESPRRYPFVVRVVFFTIVYVVLATVLTFLFSWYKTGTGNLPTKEELQKLFLIGICISVAMLLLARGRRKGLPPGA